MNERDIEKYLVKRCNDLGVLCYKFTSPQRRSVPDRILVYKGQVIFLELKAPKKKLTAAQQREQERLIAAGAFALTENSIYGIDTLLGSLTCH